MARLQACLNGRRDASEHPRLPVAPAALCRDAVEVRDAGAAMVHLHVRDGDGRESLAPDDLDAVLVPLRAAAPGLPVGISTGDWIVPDAARRPATIAGWRALPDFASVNLGEETAPAVMAALQARGVGIEAGLANVAEARRLLSLGPVPGLLRVLVEVEGDDLAAQMAEADAVLSVLSLSGLPVLMHGFEETVWPMLRRARRAGFEARVRFEDGLLLPDGMVAASNAALVAAALQA